MPLAQLTQSATPSRFGRLALERLDLGPEDEPAGVEGGGECGFELRTEWGVLRPDVDVRNPHDLLMVSRPRRRSRTTSSTTRPITASTTT